MGAKAKDDQGRACRVHKGAHGTETSVYIPTYLPTSPDDEDMTGRAGLGRTLLGYLGTGDLLEIKDM